MVISLCWYGWCLILLFCMRESRLMVRSGVEWLHSISYCLVLRMTYYQFNLSEWEASAFNRDTVIRGICWTKENNGDTNISPDLVKLNIKFWNVIAVIASLIKLTICKSNIMPTRSKWFMKNYMNVLSLEYHRSIHALSCPEVKGQLIIFFFLSFETLLTFTVYVYIVLTVPGFVFEKLFCR